jgi:tripartite-type tricarboxylate transporter receptor subunit TctC
MNRALQDAELNKRFVSEGAQIIPTTPEEFAQFIRAEAAKWGPVAKKAGMKWE